jgi:hypothetical protein
MFKLFKFSVLLATLLFLQLFGVIDPTSNSHFFRCRLFYNSAQADTTISDLPHGTDYSSFWVPGEHNLIVKGDTLYVVWSRNKLTGNEWDIYFDKNTDGGDTWGNDIRVDNTGQDSSTQRRPSLAIDSGGCICVVWSDGRGGPKRDSLFNVYFSKSCDGGQSFGLNSKVNDQYSYELSQPIIAIDTFSFNCYIYVVYPTKNRWGEWETYFYRSATCGQSWESGLKISSEINSGQAVILVDKRRYIYVFYVTFPGPWPYDTTPRQIVMRRSTDFGVTWSGPIRVDHDATNAWKWSPSAEADSTAKLYVAWQDQRNLNFDVYFSRSTDAGSTWSIERVINDDPGISDQANPSLRAKGNGEVYVCWDDLRTKASTDCDIYCAKSTDGGINWSRNILVNDTTVEKDAVQGGPHLAVGNDRAMFVAWQENRNCPRPCDKSDVYFTSLHNIEGMVFNSATKAPISGKEVVLSGYESLKDTTDVSGEYGFEILPRGNYKVFVSAQTDTHFFKPLKRNQKGINFKWTGVKYTEVGTFEQEEDVIRNVYLSQNYPNPFNPQTVISYSLTQNTRVELMIYNILGQRIRTLVDEFQTAGFKTIHWDGKDNQGEEVASGIYFYRLKAGDYSETKKMVLMK